MHRVSGVFIMLLIITGCVGENTLDLRQLDLTISVSKPAYSLAQDAGATVALRNHGSDNVYAPMNEYVYVERLENGRWVDRSPWFAIDGTSVSFPVAPGDSLVEYMNFGYVNRLPGTYRFVFELALDPEGRRRVPFERTASAPFAVQP